MIRWVTCHPWWDGLGLVLGSAIAVFALGLSLAAVRFLTASPPGATSLPLVTILKPLKGIPADLEVNLASFLTLSGPDYEVLLGVADAQDPVIEPVQQFLGVHPQAPFRLLITQPQPGLNPKMVNLMGLEPQIQGDLILISDDTTRAQPQSLERLVAAFADPKVGWACAPACIRQARTLGARLRAVFINGQLAAIQAGTYALTGIAPTMGCWLAVRKEALIQLGGFSALAPFLAEDGAIGPLLSALGWRGAVIADLPGRYPGEWTVAMAWDQAIRWARLFRQFSPGGPLVLLLLNGSVWLGLGLLLVWFGCIWGGLAFITAGIGCWLGNSHTYLRLGGNWNDILLLPLSDMKLLAVAIAAYWNAPIVWRGQTFRIGKDSRIL